MSTILKFTFQKRKQLRFSEVNYLNYTQKKPNFACDNYICPKKGKKEQAMDPFQPLKVKNCQGLNICNLKFLVNFIRKLLTFVLHNGKVLLVVCITVLLNVIHTSWALSFPNKTKIISPVTQRAVYLMAS